MLKNVTFGINEMKILSRVIRPNLDDVSRQIRRATLHRCKKYSNFFDIVMQFYAVGTMTR